MKKLFYIFLFFIISAGIYIRFRLFSASPSLWFDECSLVWNIQTTNYPDFFNPLKLVQQVSPPLFLIITKLFYSITSNFSQDLRIQDMSLRFFPFICGCISVPLFTYLVHKIYKNTYLTLACCGIMAFNIWTINYSNEVKSYGVETLLGVVFLTIIHKLKFNLKTLIPFSIFCIISMWLSSSAILFIVAASVIILCNTRNIKNLSVFFIPLIINIIIYYTTYYHPNILLYGDYMKTFWADSFFSLGTFLNEFAFHTFRLFPDIPFDAILPKTIFTLGFYIFTGLNIFLGLKYVKKNKNSKNIFITCLLIPLLMIIAGFLNLYPYDDRLIIFLIPPYTILFCQYLLYIKTTKIFTVILSLIIIFFGLINTNVARLNPTYLSIHKSNIREFYMISNQINPEQKNLIVDESNFMCYSRGNGKIVMSPENITQINTLPKDDYFVIISNTYKEKYYEIPSYIKQNCNIIKYIEAPDNKNNFFAWIRVD